MGQKAHPYGLRLGYIKPWKSRWFARRNFDALLHEDISIRKYLKDKLGFAGISNVEIERSSGRARVRIFTARPGVIIGRRGQEIDKIKEEIGNLTHSELFVDIKEVKNPHTDGQLVAENLALQLEKRVSFRKAMKKAVQMAMGKGALGIKLKCKGRLGGAEIAREEGYHEGKVPLNTLRADIDYGFAEAYTTYGLIGCKVWIYKGDVLVKKEEAERRRERQLHEVPSEPVQEKEKEKKTRKRSAKTSAETASLPAEEIPADASPAPDVQEQEGNAGTEQTEPGTGES